VLLDRPLFFVLQLLIVPFLIIVPLYTFIYVKRILLKWYIAAALALVACTTLLIVSSFLFWRPLPRIPATQPAWPDLSSALGNAQVVKNTWNEISISGQPVVAGYPRGDLNASIVLHWKRADKPIEILTRIYDVKLNAVAAARFTVDGRLTHDPFEVKEISVSPRRHVAANLIGWFDAPTLLAESGMITTWLDRNINDIITTPDTAAESPHSAQSLVINAPTSTASAPQVDSHRLELLAILVTLAIFLVGRWIERSLARQARITTVADRYIDIILAKWAATGLVPSEFSTPIVLAGIKGLHGGKEMREALSAAQLRVGFPFAPELDALSHQHLKDFMDKVALNPQDFTFQPPGRWPQKEFGV
jgi:hypothetical protein